MSNDVIGPRIRRFRKRRKITQEQLAKTLGYSGKSVISHIENGDVDMTYEKILLLIRTYAIDANDLFGVQRVDELLDDYKKTPKHDKVVVYIHGLHGSIDEINDYAFLQREFDIRGIDYPNGTPWEVGQNIEKQFAEIIKPYQEVVVIANSIGAFYAYAYLSDFPIRQAFFISPVADMHQIIQGMMKEHHISEEKLKKEGTIVLDNGQVLSYDFSQFVLNDDQWNVPTEILYGENDTMIHINDIAKWLAAHPDSRLTIKKRAKHHFHTKEEKAFIKDWILKNIKW